MKQIILTTFLFAVAVVKTFGQDDIYANNTVIYGGLSLGTWFPDKNSNVLKNPIMTGFTVGFKKGKNLFGFSFDLIFGLNTEGYQVKSGDNVLTRDHFGGGQFILDYACQFWNKDRFVLEGLCGVGYSRLSYYNPDKDTDIGKSSIVFNPGLGFKYLIGRKTFLQIKAQYHIANYKLNDNASTDFSGNYLTTKIILGSGW